MLSNYIKITEINSENNEPINLGYTPDNMILQPHRQQKTICLGMIVKNEAHIILNTLHHLSSYIPFNYWVINDNGSTDGTQDIIRNFFKEKNIPGELDETPWRDFAYNRTVVFERAYKKTDYIFVWDADDEIKGNFVFPNNDELTYDQYYFTYGNEAGLRYCRLQLFNNHLRWEYKGVLHEYPACKESKEICVKNKTKEVNGNYFFVSGRTGNRSKDPNKYLNDAIILEKAFKEAYEKGDDLYNRYAYYTAQSYNNCSMHEKSIEYYKKVLSLNNWNQEKYNSCLEIYEQYKNLGKEEDGIPYLIESYKYDNTRVECIYRLVKYYCIKGMNKVAFMFYTLIKDHYENLYVNQKYKQEDYLFMKKEDFDFYLPYYMIIVCERLKEFDTYSKMYEIIFKQRYLRVGEWWMNNLYYNIQFGINKLPKNVEFLKSMISYVKSYNTNISNIKYIRDTISYYKRDLDIECDITL